MAGLHPIKDTNDLYTYLYAALQLEHATIPVYLTALYSIHPGTNIDAVQIIRVAAVEEMLHLTLSANILNAVGGKVDLTKPDFIPTFPTRLPDGEKDFEINRYAFSRKALDMFLQIERPASTKKDNLLASGNALIKRAQGQITLLPTVKSDDGEELHYYSIGEFYHAIEEALERFCKKDGEENVFCGSNDKQITSEYYYSGGGEIIPVYDLKSAKAAIKLITEQGEGFIGEIFDSEKEIAHYYRFQQLSMEQYYSKDDQPNQPTGNVIEVDWKAAYPIKDNVSLEDLPKGSEVYTAAVEFNKAYKSFLAELTKAFNGKPEELLLAVGNMFHIKNKAIELVRNPIPNSEYHAAPTFEVDKV